MVFGIVIDDQTVFQSDYLEQADHISLATLTGVKVDLLLAPNLTDEPSSLRKVGRVECYVESLEEIIAKKIRYRRTQAKTRDVVEIGVAIIQFPEILTGLVNQNTVTLDELFEWRKTLSGLNRGRYLQELAIIEPTAIYRDSCERSPEAIIANIDAVKFDIVNSIS